MRSRGLKDDTTCVVVDIIPPAHLVSPSSPKRKQNRWKSLLFVKRGGGKQINKLSSVGAVEEIFEEGSAMLAERFSYIFPFSAYYIFSEVKLQHCASCK